MAFQRVIAEGDLWEGEKLGLLVDGRAVLLVRLGGAVYAYEDRCAHKGAPLSEGTLQGTCLTCPVHLWSYDVSKGTGVNPASAQLKSFPARVENGSVWVDLGGPSGVPAAVREEGERDAVGPVLQAGAASDAVVAAIREMNPRASVLDRGAYLRVLAPRRCRVSRAAIEKHLGRPFRLPGDLEMLMPSFQGKFVVSPSEAAWLGQGG